MKKLSLLLVLALLLMVQACVIGCDGIADKNFTIGGYKLEYSGEQKIQLDPGLAELDIEVGIAGIDLNGEGASAPELIVNYQEYRPGDAIISVEDGEIKTESKSGKPVLITSISGTVPANMNLKIENGTGPTKISNLKDVGSLKVESGTGKVELVSIRSKHISLECGTGRVNMEDCIAVNAVIDTGTGSVDMKDSYIEYANVNSGTGSLNLVNSTIEYPEFASGVGKLHQEGKYKSAK